MNPSDPRFIWLEESVERGLVRSALQGSRQAFLALADHFVKPIYRLAYALVRDRATAAGIAREAFGRTWSEMEGLPEGKRFFPWVLHTARDLSVARLSRHSSDGHLAAAENPGSHGDRGVGVIYATLPRLCTYLDGELAEASVELVRRHLSVCLECTGRVMHLGEQDEILARILGDEPDEEFFRRLCESIPLGQPMRVARPASDERPKRTRPDPRRHREDQREDQEGTAASPRSAWFAAVVCCIVAASAAWVVVRPHRAPLVADPVVVERETPAPGAEPLAEIEPSPAPPAIPALPMEAPTAAEAGVVTVTSEAMPKQMAAVAPPLERLVERAPQNFVPVRTVITETIIQPETPDSAPAAAALRVSGPGTVSDPGALAVRSAKSASLEAARTKLPATFDESAEAWERAFPLLENEPETLAMARRESAQSRFQAWAAEPTSARREAAIASARQYLLYAPPGPERDQAWTWLGRLKH